MSNDLAFPERGLRLRYGGQSEEVLRVGQALLEADYARDPLHATGILVASPRKK